MKISKIILYDETTVPQIQLNQLIKFLKNNFPIEIETRENILKLAKKNTAYKIAQCKVFHLGKDFEEHIPTEEEILFEDSNNQDTSNTENIIMYDGFRLQKVLAELISDKKTIKISFT